LAHPVAKVSEQVNRKCPLGSRSYNFQHPTPTLSPQTFHFLNNRRWCHLANTLKHTVKKRTAKIFTSGIGIVSMHGYSRQCCTIGSLSATAGHVYNSEKWPLEVGKQIVHSFTLASLLVEFLRLNNVIGWLTCYSCS